MNSQHSFYIEIEENKIEAFYDLVESAKRYYKIMGIEMPKETLRLGIGLEMKLAEHELIKRTRPIVKNQSELNEELNSHGYSINEEVQRR